MDREGAGTGSVPSGRNIRAVVTIALALFAGGVMIGALVPGISVVSGAGGAAVALAAPAGSPSPVPYAAAPTLPASSIGATPLSPTLGALPPSNIHLGSFVLPGPHPSSWGAAGVPPGWEAVLPQAPSPQAGWSSGGGAGSGNPSPATNWDNRLCAGLWPGFDDVWGHSAQGAYASGCYGHDEPGIQFYSTLPGSGGNVTWDVTLPVDRSFTLNQSNLYSAMWFGMAMNDPYGWLNQCFLELQFYPDQTFYNPGPLFPNATVNGAWVGAAVAWQIQASTGAEDPCFYEPLYLNGTPGPAYLNMTQGDHIQVRMNGWVGDAKGEILTITDLSNGQRSFVRLYNHALGYPIDPAYRTNSYPGAFEWTPGGEYPVAFAFETGHAGNPDWPANNSYGGCSGGPTSTPQDPGAPCPSYDPGSWANDTLRPWVIHTPTFSNAGATDTPSQVAFTQPEGAMDLVDQTSNGVCNAVEGSAWCSYPWYSYYCSSHAFEFGALDYPGAATDFGKWTQFDRVQQSNPLGIGYFPPTNFSVPSCGGTSATVGISTSGPSGGSVYFLSQDYASPGSVSGVSVGNYSIHAITTPGPAFGHWATTGLVSVASAGSPWTTLEVHGSGTVKAVYTTVPRTTNVTFRDFPGGMVGVGPTLTLFGAGSGLGTVANGGSLALAPGIYSIQAYAQPGFNFTAWTYSSPAAAVAATPFPVTWLVVTGAVANATVAAHFTASTLTSTLGIYVIGTGSYRVGPLTVSNVGPGFNFGSMQLRVGTYPSVITPGPHTLQTSILYGTSVVISNFSLRSQVMLQNGTALLEVIFTQGVSVTFQATPASGGSIGVVSLATGGSSLVASGTTLNLPTGLYELLALPSSGMVFVDWTSNSGNGSFVSSPSYVAVDVQVSGRVTLAAHFLAAAHSVSVRFKDAPLGGGEVAFNGAHLYTSGQFNASVGGGEYIVSALPSAGWEFIGWTATGGVSVLTSPGSANAVIAVSAHGTLSARFAQVLYPVTLVVFSPTGSHVPAASLSVAGQTVHSGDTVWLAAGSHAIHFHGVAFAGWDTTAAFAVASSSSPSTTLTVGGPGTLYATL